MKTFFSCLIVFALLVIWQGCGDGKWSSNNPAGPDGKSAPPQTTAITTTIEDMVAPNDARILRDKAVKSTGAAVATLWMAGTNGTCFWVADIWDLNNISYRVPLGPSVWDDGFASYVFQARIMLPDGHFMQVCKLRAALSSTPWNKVDLQDVRTIAFAPYANMFGGFFFVKIDNGQISSPRNPVSPYAVLEFRYDGMPSQNSYGQAAHSLSFTINPSSSNQRSVLYQSGSSWYVPGAPVQTNQPFYVEVSFLKSPTWRQVMDSSLWVRALDPSNMWILLDWTRVVHRSAWSDLHDWTTSDINWWANKVQLNYVGGYSFAQFSDNRAGGGGSGSDTIIISPAAGHSIRVPIFDYIRTQSLMTNIMTNIMTDQLPMQINNGSAVRIQNVSQKWFSKMEQNPAKSEQILQDLGYALAKVPWTRSQQ